MYKKAPEGMVAQRFTLADPNIPVGSLVALTADMTVGVSGANVIGELVAKDTTGTIPYGTVELKGSKIMDVTAGAGGVTFGTRVKLSAANTVIADAAGDLFVLKGATVGNTAVVTYY